MARVAGALIILVSLTSACSGPSEPGCPRDCPTRPPRVTSETALAYLNSALDIMQRASINKYEIDWPLLRAQAIDSAAGAEARSETYPAIVFALGQLRDRHSSFIYPGGLETVPAGATPLQGGQLRAQLIDNDIAWILLPNTYSVGTSASWQDQAQRLVAEMDRTSTCGWILDLRRNPGGNMWPMIVAIGPLLGEGEIGSFVTPDSTRTTWFYSATGEAGLVNAGQRVILSSVSASHRLLHQTPPVAVLIGPNTASSGEAVAVAFHGRPRTQFFGQSTAGVPTANSVMPLSDGAAMNLTVGADVDRNDVVFWPDPVRPDVLTSTAVVDPTSGLDEAVSAARSWLHSQAECRQTP